MFFFLNKQIFFTFSCTTFCKFLHFFPRLFVVTSHFFPRLFVKSIFADIAKKYLHYLNIRIIFGHRKIQKIQY